MSHLNACNTKGLSWVDEVLVTGLRNGDKISDWRIEVHSSDENDDSNSNSDNDDEVEKEYGPAVYIIQKVAVSDDRVKKRKADIEVSRANIKFFGY